MSIEMDNYLMGITTRPAPYAAPDNSVGELEELKAANATLRQERDALLEDKARLEKRVYLTVSLCCFPNRQEAEFTYENRDGAKVAFTLKMPKEIMQDVANVISPCVYYDAAIDAAKGGKV